MTGKVQIILKSEVFFMFWQ